MMRTIIALIALCLALDAAARSQDPSQEVERIAEAAGLPLDVAVPKAPPMSQAEREAAQKTVLRARALERSGALRELSPEERAFVEYNRLAIDVEAWITLQERRKLLPLVRDERLLEARAREIYENQKTRFQTPAQARITNLFIDLERRGLEGAQKHLEEIRRALAAGRDFVELARQFTDDPAVRQKGADVTFNIVEEQADPTVARRIFRQMKPGEISGPHAVSGGLILFRLESLTPAAIQPFEAVRGQLLRQAREEIGRRFRAEAFATLDTKLEENTPTEAGTRPRDERPRP